VCTEDQLEVLSDEEHHAEHRQEDEDHPACPGAEGRVTEQADVEHRLIDTQLPRCEQAEHYCGDCERDERLRTAQPSWGPSIRP